MIHFKIFWFKKIRFDYLRTWSETHHFLVLAISTKKSSLKYNSPLKLILQHQPSLPRDHLTASATTTKRSSWNIFRHSKFLQCHPLPQKDHLEVQIATIKRSFWSISHQPKIILNSISRHQNHLTASASVTKKSSYSISHRHPKIIMKHQISQKEHFEL